jgi:uncharacterized protein (TIGR03118 family)
VTDPHLVNGWGLASSSASPIWVSDNGADVSTLYNGTTGQPVQVTGQPTQLVVSIAGGAPTGVVFNGSNDFVVSSCGKSGAARFIFAGENGVISGWNPNVDGTHSIAEHSDTNAVY